MAFDALGRAVSNTTTVHIASGTYALTKELVLDTPCQILGAGMRATVLDGEALPKSARCLSLSAAGSRVVGLTLRNCKTLIQGAGLRMSADGWVEDVLIYGNEIGKGGGSTPAPGAGLWQSAGVVTNCVIENNSQNSTYGTGEGAGVYISSGNASPVKLTRTRGCFDQTAAPPILRPFHPHLSISQAAGIFTIPPSRS